MDVERIIPHPCYSSTKLTNDIALIKLKMPAKLNSRVQTICLPAKNSRPMIGSSDATCQVGFKTTNHNLLCSKKVLPLHDSKSIKK